jgi:hypothetical protein
VRTALYTSALVESRANPVIAAYYGKTARRPQKPASRPLVAGMRRLVVILNAIRRDHKAWQIA